MLPELGSRLSYNPQGKNAENRSPYLLQLKVFEDRLRRQEKQGIKPVSHSQKTRKQAGPKQDFLEFTRGILSKKQNFNMLEGLPTDTQQSLEIPKAKLQITAKTRDLFQRSFNVKKPSKHYYKENLRENSVNNQNQRVLSQAYTHLVRNKAKSSDISFIGYKRGRKCVENGFKKIWGLV